MSKFTVQQKLAQYYKSTIFKKKKQNGAIVLSRGGALEDSLGGDLKKQQLKFIVMMG